MSTRSTHNMVLGFLMAGAILLCSGVGALFQGQWLLMLLYLVSGVFTIVLTVYLAPEPRSHTPFHTDENREYWEHQFTDTPEGAAQMDATYVRSQMSPTPDQGLDTTPSTATAWVVGISYDEGLVYLSVDGEHTAYPLHLFTATQLQGAEMAWPDIQELLFSECDNPLEAYRLGQYEHYMLKQHVA